MNEFDRFVLHKLKPIAYLRYGDDWLCFGFTQTEADQMRVQARTFLDNQLSLTINTKIDYVQPTYKGTSYLGVDIWPNGRRLLEPVRRRIDTKLDKRNVSSYKALISAHEQSKWLKRVDWQLLDLP